LDLLESARRAVKEENFRSINEARRNFLKYISHELRSPLNSLTIGIDILENSEGRTESDLESLGLMKDASSFMSDTLNNVLSIQKIEEGCHTHPKCSFPKSIPS
jgi:signal transduction histidine kinase